MKLVIFFHFYLCYQYNFFFVSIVYWYYYFFCLNFKMFGDFFLYIDTVLHGFLCYDIYRYCFWSCCHFAMLLLFLLFLCVHYRYLSSLLLMSDMFLTMSYLFCHVVILVLKLTWATGSNSKKLYKYGNSKPGYRVD